MVLQFRNYINFLNGQAITYKGFLGGSEGNLGSIPELEDPLEEGMATFSSILARRITMDRGAW